VKIVEELAEKHQVTPRPISDEENSDRLISAIVNDDANILSEGIALCPSDIDAVLAYGYAFPVFRGGPMHYAETFGLRKVYDSICQYRDMYGESIWKPTPLLEQLARKEKTFKQWAEERES
jgi:3-hydroxyacyl-CoA dehydrogenase